jgi:DNA polymerase-3 subunit delta'
MAFSGIVGHQKQLETLKRSLEADRLHHAYIFVGPDGVGKRTVAYSLASAIHCSNGDNHACGQCEACLRIRDGNHPDIHSVGLETGKKEISIQQIRDLQQQLVFRSFSGKKKVVIIDPAQLLNYHAQNSLLKTLEEPPGDSLLILIANSTGNILSTIMSRCLHLYFPFLSLRLVAEVLVERKKISADQASLLASLTRGSLGDALNSNANDLFDQRREWIERLCSLSGPNIHGVMALAEQVASDRELSLLFLEWIKRWYRDILIHQISGSPEEMTNPDMLEEIRETAASNTVDHTLSILSRVESVAGMIKRNYNRRLVLENFLMKVAS